MTEAPNTEAEFVNRFISHMLKMAGPRFDDGTSVEMYAREVAPSYWEEPAQRPDGPAECAESDMFYWGED